MNRREELNDKLKSIYDKFNLITMHPSNDFVDDYTVYSSILFDKYEKVEAGFWKYFKQKYELPELTEYFNSPYELLKMVFDRCIHPFYLRLDILPNYNAKYDRLAFVFDKSWKINRFFSNNWITIISLILMFLFFGLASSIDNRDSFGYDIFMSISTGFMISLIVSSINTSHKKRLKKKIRELNNILYEFEKLKKSYEKTKGIIINDEIEENSKFVTEFCIMNNALNDFIGNTKDIESLKTVDIYHRLKDFEKEIFDYSSQVVQKDFHKYVMDQTSDEEVAVLQKYVIQLGYWIAHFDFDIASLRHYYGVDIEKMENKSL